MTSLAPIPTDKLDALLKRAGTKVVDILTELGRTKAERLQDRQERERKPLPKPVAVKPEDRRTLRTIVDQVQAFDFPTDVRTLTPEERKTAIELFDKIKNAHKVLTKFEDTFKLTFHNHLDVELGDRARRLDQDEHGHYVAAGKVEHPDLDICVTRELRGGNAVAPSLEQLEQLVEEGRLSPVDFKTMTLQIPRKVTPAHRVVSEEGILRAMKNNPEVLTALGRIVRLTDQSTAMQVRPVKAVDR